jgi:hypothetical protein
MTTEEVKKIAETSPDSVLIGNEDERDRYYPAIVAFDEKSGRFIYDYNRLVEAFAEGFKDSEDPYGEALEWVDYNVIRSLPYCGVAPFVLYRDEDSDDVIDACASELAEERIVKLYEDGMKQ